MSDRPQHPNHAGQPSSSDSPQTDPDTQSVSPTQEIRDSDTPIPPVSEEKIGPTANQQGWPGDAELTQPQPPYGDAESTQQFPPDLNQQQAATHQWAPQPTQQQWAQPGHPPHTQQQWGQQNYPQQGYPQQNYQGPGYPQQWPQQTNAPPGAGQPPYGQPPGQWQQPYPGGYQQAAAQQPKRSRAWLYVIIAVLAVALIALLGWLFFGPEDDTSQPAATQSESQELEAEEPETEEAPQDDPVTEEEEPEGGSLPNPFQNPEDREFDLPDFGSVPDMPESVGDYQALAGTFPTLTMYSNPSNNDVLIATYMFTKPLPEDYVDDALGPNTHGDWTCSSSDGSEEVACTAKAQDGFVMLVAGIDEASLAGLGDEFLDDWK